MKKIYFFGLLFLFSMSCNSQGSIIGKEKRINSFLISDNWIYDSLKFKGRNITSFKLDTFNVCRIQKSKIKSITKLKINKTLDTIRYRKVMYNKFGISDAFNLKSDTLLEFDPQKLEPDCSDYNLKYISNNRGTNIERDFLNHEKTIYKFDSLGFLSEHIQMTTGILNKWISMMVNGYIVLHRKYEYSNNYKEVKITWLFKRKIKSKENLGKSIWYLKFDENRNLLSEKEYYVNELGELIFEIGFIYEYEYYE